MGIPQHPFTMTDGICITRPAQPRRGRSIAPPNNVVFEGR